MLAIRSILSVMMFVIFGCAPSLHPASSPDLGNKLQVKLVDDEATRALAILEKEFASRPADDNDWRRLFSAEGYLRLKQREDYMKRTFTDSDFRNFIQSDTLIRRTPALREAVAGFQRVDVSSAARQALGYLPKGARITARLYPEIKPHTNSFVFSPDSIPGVFLYVDPARTSADFQNTLTHELHHIGLNSVCPSEPDTSLKEPLRTLVFRMGGFGEGFAMLAAAGSPDSNAHYESDSASRSQWDRDVANHEANLRLLEKFFLDVVEGRVTLPDSVNALANQFYGGQGPWYTVGWKMSVTIEKVFGRDSLLAVMCDPRTLLRRYNDAVVVWNRSRAEQLPIWSERLMRQLKAT
jgi:hypothetical protein